MKRLFTAISILFLTMSLYSKEFILPSFRKNMEDFIENIKDEDFNCVYNEEEDYYEVTNKYFRFYGVDTKEIVVSKGVDGVYYSVYIFFEDADLNEYTKCIFNLLQDYEIQNTELFTTQDLAMAIKEYTNYALLICFQDLELKNNVYKTISIMKAVK